MPSAFAHIPQSVVTLISDHDLISSSESQSEFGTIHTGINRDVALRQKTPETLSYSSHQQRPKNKTNDGGRNADKAISSP